MTTTEETNSQPLLSSEHSYKSSLDAVESVSITWKEIHVTVKKGGRNLLKGVSGTAPSGKLLALMGASGAGKTTLLNTLLGRNLKGLKITGEVLVNGTDIGHEITNVSGYAQQEELFIGTLTVREYLNIQARLRVNGNTEFRTLRVNIVLRQLGLAKCANTRIGIIGVKKGISGGEARRLTFACELLSNPPILFCDEPTSGLDSFMAETVVNELSKLASSGRTVICTIHQPASQLYDMFDSVMFLAGGKCAFYGSPKDSITFFEQNGYPCPKNYNPADLIIHTLAIAPGKEEECQQRIDHLTFLFVESEHGKKLESDLENVLQIEVPEGRRRVGCYTQFLTLSHRAALENWRNKSLTRAKLIQKFLLGLFIAVLYFQTDPKTPEGKENINGALFFIVCELTYATMFGILTFLPNDFPLVVREYHDGLYGLCWYYISRSLSFLPLFSVDGLLLIFISYFAIGLNATFSQILTCAVVTLLIEQCAVSFGIMLSTISPSYPVAVSIAGPLTTIMSLTGGLYANVGYLPKYIAWTQYISWFKYGFEALVINQWNKVNEIDGWDEKQRNEILSTLSFKPSVLYWNMLAMVGTIILFYSIGFLGLYIRVRRSR